MTSVGKWAPARTRSMPTNVVTAVPATNVIHGRALRGERANARYVAVAVIAAESEVCPEKNDSELSVSGLQGFPGFCLQSSASWYALGRGRRTAIFARFVRPHAVSYTHLTLPTILRV